MKAAWFSISVCRGTALLNELCSKKWGSKPESREMLWNVLKRLKQVKTLNGCFGGSEACQRHVASFCLLARPLMFAVWKSVRYGRGYGKHPFLVPGLAIDAERLGCLGCLGWPMLKGGCQCSERVTCSTSFYQDFYTHVYLDVIWTSRQSHIYVSLCHLFWMCFLYFHYFLMHFLDLCPFAFCLSAISEMGCVLFRSAPRFKGPDLGRDPTAAEEQTFEADPGPGQHRAAFSQKK